NNRDVEPSRQFGVGVRRPLVSSRSMWKDTSAIAPIPAIVTNYSRGFLGTPDALTHSVENKLLPWRPGNPERSTEVRILDQVPREPGDLLGARVNRNRSSRG